MRAGRLSKLPPLLVGGSLGKDDSPAPPLPERLMAKRPRKRSSMNADPALPKDAAVESVLGHLAWLADVEHEWPERRLPLGWAFRVYNAAVVLRLRWHNSITLRSALAPTTLTKLDKAIARLLAASSDSIDELRTPKGLAKASTLTMPVADRTRLADSLEKLLPPMAKHVYGGPVPPRRAPEYEKRLLVEAFLAEITSGTGAAIEDQRLAEYCRSLGDVIAVTGPKAAALSPSNRVLATQLATAALQVSASHLGSEHKRERTAAKALVRSLRATTKARP